MVEEAAARAKAPQRERARRARMEEKAMERIEEEERVAALPRETIPAGGRKRQLPPRLEKERRRRKIGKVEG
jgi:hypothetical protein